MGFFNEIFNAFIPDKKSAPTRSEPASSEQSPSQGDKPTLDLQREKIDRETPALGDALEKYFADKPVFKVPLHKIANRDPDVVRQELNQQELDLRLEYAKFSAAFPSEIRGLLPDFEELPDLTYLPEIEGKEVWERQSADQSEPKYAQLIEVLPSSEDDRRVLSRLQSFVIAADDLRDASRAVEQGNI